MAVCYLCTLTNTVCLFFIIIKELKNFMFIHPTIFFFVNLFKHFLKKLVFYIFYSKKQSSFFHFVLTKYIALSILLLPRPELKTHQYWMLWIVIFSDVYNINFLIRVNIEFMTQHFHILTMSSSRKRQITISATGEFFYFSSFRQHHQIGYQ